MSTAIWSFLLQWSRVGIGAGVFLIAARFLTLAEIGAFATAFAPVRLAQSLHKAGIAEATIITGTDPRRLNALFALSLGLAALSAAALLVGATIVPAPVSAFLVPLAALPVIHGLSAVSEGILRQRLALRALALRTLFAQTVAAMATLTALAAGWGAGALVAFALVNALITGGLSMHLAHWRPTALPHLDDVSLTLRKTLQIAGRDLTSGATLPLAQLAIGAVLGLTAAGAFQIATRILALVDSLTIAPLRYLALPRFALIVQTDQFAPALRRSLGHAALLGAWVWGGVIGAAPQILAVAVGPQHAAPAAPILLALVPLGVLSALLMPINQALTAQGNTGLVLARAALTLALSLIFCAPAVFLSPSLATVALSAASVLTSLWYVARALPRLGLRPDALIVALPALLSGGCMATMLIELSPMLAPLHPALALLVQILLGSCLYALLVSVFRLYPLRRIPV